MDQNDKKLTVTCGHSMYVHVRKLLWEPTYTYIYDMI